MVTNFSSPIKGQNNGSCNRLATYLDKEQTQEQFFSSDQEQVSKLEVIQAIDRNGENQGLKSGQDRFFTFTIDPSKSELQHIGSDSDKLKLYTRQVMENYAANFNKGLKGDDLVWYARIEHSRSYTHDDKAVQEGKQQKGQPKEGDQTHVHIIVSRFKERPNESERTASLSPLTNHRKEAANGVKSGFDRVNFIHANERAFDQCFKYERPLTETFEYAKSASSEHQPDRLASREREIKAQIERDRLKQEQEYKREQVYNRGQGIGL